MLLEVLKDLYPSGLFSSASKIPSLTPVEVKFEPLNLNLKILYQKVSSDDSDSKIPEHPITKATWSVAKHIPVISGVKFQMEKIFGKVLHQAREKYLHNAPC